MIHASDQFQEDPQAEMCRAEWVRRRRRQRVGGRILMGWVVLVTVFVVLPALSAILHS